MSPLTLDITNALEVVAGTAWGEARGGGVQGMQSVCNVIMNRAAHPGWWGTTPLEICLKPWQFSCWNENDPNKPKIIAVDPSDSDYAIALGLAKKALNGSLPDITGGADSYYDQSIDAPDWAEQATYTATIAGQLFYKTETA